MRTSSQLQASNQSQCERNFSCSYGLGHHLKHRICHLTFINTDLFIFSRIICQAFSFTRLASEKQTAKRGRSVRERVRWNEKGVPEYEGET